MLDGDNTYSSKEIPRLIEPLENNFCEMCGTSPGQVRKKYKQLKS